MTDTRSSPYAVWHGTTILTVRKDGKVVIAGDGQVSMGDTIMKGNARKVRPLGSGGNHALAAARALADTDLTAEEIARKAMKIAADICVYTNNNLTVEILDA